MKDKIAYISEIRNSLSELEELLTKNDTFSLFAHTSLKEKIKKANSSLEKLNNEINASLLTFFDKEISSLQQNITSLEQENKNLMSQTTSITNKEHSPLIESVPTSNTEDDPIIVAEASYTEPGVDRPEVVIREEVPKKVESASEPKEQSLHEKLSEQNQKQRAS